MAKADGRDGGSLLQFPGERVVVVGAGFLGSRIAASALERELPTVILTRSPNVDPALAARGARIVIGDASDPEVVDRALRNATHVIHCAGGRLPTDSVDDPAADAVGTLRPLITVLEALRRGSGARLTYLSSGGTVYGQPRAEPVDEEHPCRPLMPYGVSRLAAEGYVSVAASLHGLPARILRLGNVYGPGQPTGRRQGVVAMLLEAAREGLPAPIYGNGAVARDYVHIDDVADVVHRLPLPANDVEVLNVATGRARSVLEVIDIVEAVTGRPLLLQRWPERPFDVLRIALSQRRLAAMIPYTPLSLERGIERTWRAETAAPSDVAVVARKV